MILSFRSSALKRLYERGDSSRINPDHAETVREILARLDAALAPEDMALPAYRLHRLRGNYKGFWAVTVRANWRVIFRFKEGHAVNVDYLDYH